MGYWLYQMSDNVWSQERYRADIWEGNDTTWDTNKMSPAGSVLVSGDIIVLFYAKSSGSDCGIYGWGIILWSDGDEVRFRPTPPSNYLKMNPLWNNTINTCVDTIRKGMPRGTMWAIEKKQMDILRKEIAQII